MSCFFSNFAFDFEMWLMVKVNQFGIALFVVLTMSVVACSNGGGSSKETDEADSVVTDDTLEMDSLILLDEQPVSVLADELFDDFFYNFISDVQFQRERTDYPMKKHKGSIFEHFSTQDFFSVIYEHDRDLALLKDTTLRKVGVEWIYLDSMVIDRFNFRKIDGEWLLVTRSEYAMDSTLNADFFDFYERFVNDTIYQKESLGDGVTFSIPASEGDDAIDSIVTAETWTDFCADKQLFNPVLVNIDYGQKLEADNKRDILFHGFSNGVSIEFRFEKEDKRWLLKSIEL